MFWSIYWFWNDFGENDFYHPFSKSWKFLDFFQFWEIFREKITGHETTNIENFRKFVHQNAIKGGGVEGHKLQKLFGVPSDLSRMVMITYPTAQLRSLENK